METITDELSWWPTEPLDRWTTTMLEQVVGVGAALNQPAVLQVCINKGALDIRRWAEQKLRAMQEKVRECMRVDGSCLVLRSGRWKGSSFRLISSGVGSTVCDATEGV